MKLFRSALLALLLAAPPALAASPGVTLYDGSNQPIGTPSNPLAISGGSSVLATIVTGQIRIAATGTAVRLPTNALVNGVVVKASTTNAANGFVGGSTVTTLYDGTGAGFPLEPGASASFAATNTSAVYVNGSAGDVFSFEGN